MSVSDQRMKLVRVALCLLFSAIFGAMLSMTIWASLDRAVWNAGGALLSDRWFQATLVDAYLGFVTFYVWVAYKERTWLFRIIWFVLVMLLGNMAMSAYVLLQLWRWETTSGFRGLLLRTD